MKWKPTLTGLALGIAALLVAALGLALARPDLVPAQARLFGRAAPEAGADSGLYCQEHGVPEAFCTLCHEELKAKLLLCKEHGDTPEDICTLCHPEVEAQHKIEMCPRGHGLPKHFCVECGKAPSAAAEMPDDGWCVAHNQPEDGCAACLATGRSDSCRRPLPMIRLATAQMARRVGIETTSATTDRHAHDLEGNAEVAYNANAYAEVRPRVRGLIHQVLTDEGRFVRKGEVLAVIDSSEVGSAKAQYLAALPVYELASSRLDRTLSLLRSNAVPRKEELEARTALHKAKAGLLDAKQRLLNLGLSEAALAEVARTEDTSSHLNTVSPIDGTIVERHAVAGESVEPTHQLFVVVDTRVMWAWVDVGESEVDQVRPGQDVTFTISGTETPVFKGRVDWIDAAVHPTTRTVRVRTELTNADGRLRANQFGRAALRVGDEHDTVIVPRSALQTDGTSDVVFLPEDDRSFRPQRVVARPARSGEVIEVAWGLKPGQRVVTTGAFLLKSELLKAEIGDGCCK